MAGPDEQAWFEHLVRAHRVHVRRYLLFLGCPEDTTDDLVQDTFLVALRRRRRGVATEDARAWLRAVARNLTRNARRQYAAAPISWRDEMAEAEAFWVGHYRGDDAEDQVIDQLRACVAALPEREREAVELRYREQRSRRAIAERLNLTEAGVKALLRRSRARLKRCLDSKTETIS